MSKWSKLSFVKYSQNKNVETEFFSKNVKSVESGICWTELVFKNFHLILNWKCRMCFSLKICSQSCYENETEIFFKYLQAKWVCVICVTRVTKLSLSSNIHSQLNVENFKTEFKNYLKVVNYFQLSSNRKFKELLAFKKLQSCVINVETEFFFKCFHSVECRNQYCLQIYLLLINQYSIRSSVENVCSQLRAKMSNWNLKI